MLGIHISKRAPCNISDIEGKKIKERMEMQKGGQGTQVYLLHRQNLAADIHPVSFLWHQLIF